VFYERYIELCKAKGLSASAAATAIGFSKSSVSHWKTSGSQPRYELIFKIAEFFDVPVESLATEEIRDYRVQITNSKEQATDKKQISNIAEAEPIAETEAAPETEPIAEVVAETEPIAVQEIASVPETAPEAESLPEAEVLAPVPEAEPITQSPPIVQYISGSNLSSVEYSSLTNEAIREIRRSRRISLTTAAREIGVSPAELQAYEEGASDLRAYRKVKLKRLLKV
jgi:transcriptional regulator with XRE-family HTH domain